jgi:hypothetical protein
MNYIIEDNIDFYKELNNEYDNEIIMNNNNNNNEKCMLTHQHLTENYITLPCKHVFNYIPLYNEVCTKLLSNNYDSDKLRNNEIRCPYCRTKFDKLLPYINYDGVEKKNGINWPEKDSMKHMDCCWLYKSGKQKGQLCNKNGYQKGSEVYCYIHWIMINNSKKINKNTNNTETTDDEWTEEMETLYKANHIIGLKKILRDKGLLLGGTKKILVKRIIYANNNIISNK